MKEELQSYGVGHEFFVERTEIETALLAARSSRTEPATAAAAATSRPSTTEPSPPRPPSKKTGPKIDRDAISSLGIKQLKTELQSYGIDTASFLDKASLVDQVVKSRSEGWRQPTERNVPVRTDDGHGPFASPPFATSGAGSTSRTTTTTSNSSRGKGTSAGTGPNNENSQTNSNDNADPYGPLKDGEEIRVKRYTIRREGSNYVCTCLGWRYQSKTKGEARICKHISELRGDDAVYADAADDTGTASKKRSASSESSLDGVSKKKRARNGDETDDGADEKGGGDEDSGLPVTVALAKVWKESDSVAGWYMSEKLDGMRCVWDGVSKLWTRSGNEIYAPAFFTDALPLGTVLDGELFLGRGQFQECMSIARRHGGNEADWRRLSLVVFDAPEITEDFATRLQAVRAVLIGYATPTSIARVLPQTICGGRTHVLEELEKITAAGGEGVMLRSPSAPYKGGRVSDLLKVKKFIDDEAVVAGHEQGKGRHSGRMGAIMCTMMGSGKQFKIGTGFTDAQREWNNAPPIGSTVTYRYFELTKAGIPRFPSFIRIRPLE